MSTINIAQSIRGFIEVYLLNTGMRFDIFSILHNAKGLTTQELAEKLAIKEKYATMWCNTAYAFNVLEKEGGKFFLKKELHEILANKDSTQYMGDVIRGLASYYGKDMENQYDFIKSDKSFPFYEHDKGLVEIVVRRGKQRGNLFLEKVIPLVEGLEEDLSTGLNVLDVGCGGGSFIIKLAETFIKSRFTGVDIDYKSIQTAKEEISKNDFNERISFLQTSAHEIDFFEKFDAITMNLVLHEVDPSHREELIGKLYKALKQNSKLIILEFPYPEEDQDFFDPNYGMGIIDQFFEITWGTEHLTWSQQKALLSKYGFNNMKRTFLGDNAYVLITAEK